MYSVSFARDAAILTEGGYRLDSVTPLEQGKHLVSVLADGALVTMPGIGHIPQLEDERAFNALLLEQLARRVPPRP